MERLIQSNFGKPTVCDKCSSTKIEYKGVGEYLCSDCGNLMYDEYGKVRNYLEKNPGATQSEVAKATGVAKSKISLMLKDDKIEISAGSMVFMHCEKCGAEIRSGRLCDRCEREKLSEMKNARVSNVSGGFSKSKSESGGAKRFTR